MIYGNGERRLYMNDDAVRRAKAELYRLKLFQYYLQLRNAPEEVVEAREEELHDNLRSMGFDPVQGTISSTTITTDDLNDIEQPDEQLGEDGVLPKKTVLLC